MTSQQPSSVILAKKKGGGACVISSQIAASGTHLMMAADIRGIYPHRREEALETHCRSATSATIAMVEDVKLQSSAMPP